MSKSDGRAKVADGSESQLALGKPIPAAPWRILDRGPMRILKRLDGLAWEKMVIALALSAIAAWSLGWIAGTIVSVIARR